MSDKYEICEYEDGFKRVLKNGKAINEFGLLKDVQKLQAENAELKKQNQWISVDDELPKNDSQVIAWVGSRALNLTYCDNGYWCEHYGTRCFSSYVTHFMPLPTPPKGE